MHIQAKADLKKFDMLDYHELAQRQIEETFGKCVEETKPNKFLKYFAATIVRWGHSVPKEMNVD